MFTINTIFLVACSKPLDVAFALDSSDDVSSFQWQRQKDFVSKVIDGLQIAPDGVHTGIVAYAAIPTVDLRLDVRSEDKMALLQSLAGLRRAVGERNIGSLLDMSKYQVFGIQHQLTISVPPYSSSKILIAVDHH